jgi:hypothetical protein
MNGYPISLNGAALQALPSGALWWADARLLCVSDLHLGKSDRQARRRGLMLPPYDGIETLARLGDEIARTAPETVICLGDSFDDLTAAADLPEDLRVRLCALIDGRDWVWVEGNHDPGPTGLPGRAMADCRIGPLVFRHIATAPGGEVSGHYHPKAQIVLRGGTVRRPCFLADAQRLILPAFGTYTGGLSTTAPELCAIMSDDARAILTGSQCHGVPMPRHSPPSRGPAGRHRRRAGRPQVQ